MDIEQTFATFCTFCSQELNLNSSSLVIKGEEGFICQTCLEECIGRLNEHNNRLNEESKINKELQIKPSSVMKHLSEYIIDQDQAKKVLSVAIYNHFKFLRNKSDPNSSVEMEKSNILLVGPTGSGKTAMIKCLGKLLNIPIAIADSTNLTQAGYVGEDPENILRTLIQNANEDIELAERGIIYIDEIDKLGRKGENLSITRDVGGEGVQQALLKIIEGCVIDVPPKGQRKHPNQECHRIDTTNILFVVGGSFEGIEKIIQKRQKNGTSKIGFGQKVNSAKEKEFNDCILDVKVEDLKKFGMLPELLGRLPIIAPMKELTEEALIKILTEPKNAIVKQFTESLKMDNIDFEITDQALIAIAKKAIERKTGARALRSIMEDLMLESMYLLPDQEDVVKVVIDEECVTTGAEPKLIKKNKAA